MVAQNRSVFVNCNGDDVALFASAWNYEFAIAFLLVHSCFASVNVDSRIAKFNSTFKICLDRVQTIDITMYLLLV